MLTRRATREAGSQVGTIATPPSPHPDSRTAPERPPRARWDAAVLPRTEDPSDSPFLTVAG